jgi:hypothetical protein
MQRFQAAHSGHIFIKKNYIKIVFFKNMKLTNLKKTEIIDNIVDAEFLQFYKAIKNIVNLDKFIIEIEMQYFFNSTKANSSNSLSFNAKRII